MADNSSDYFLAAAKQEARHYIEKLRRNDESVFFDLLESTQDVLPFLITAFNEETAPNLRTKLLEIIWNKRDTRALPVLKDALYDSEPMIWQTALDGLVTLASRESLAILETSMERVFNKPSERAEFQTWVAEAIEQTKEELSKA